MSDEKPNKKANIWAYALIGAAGLGMLLFDVNPFQRSGSQTVASVGEQEISAAQLNNAISTLQGQLPNLDGKTLQQQALAQLVRQALLEEHARQSDFTYPDSALRDHIKALFGDNTAYEQWLRERQISAKSYQESLRQSESIRSYYQTLAATAPNASPLFDALLADFAQEHDYTVIRLPLQAAAQTLKPDPAAVRAYYDAHPEQFLTPERVSVRYFILDSAALASPEALATLGEQRAGRYLIFDDKSAADSAAQAIVSGEKSFADIAADINAGVIAGESGDLPLQLHGKGVDPVVDDALFALAQEGDVSPVISSDNFNAMLVVLDQRKAGDDSQKESLAREAGSARYAELAEKAFDAALSNAPLSQIADMSGQRVQTLENLTPENAEEWARNAKVQHSLFGANATDINKIAEPVELAPGQSVFYEITARQLPEPQPFETVAADAQAAWLNSEAAKILDERSAALVKAWENGDNLDALIAEYGGEKHSYNGVNQLLPPDNIPPELVRSLSQQAERIGSSSADNGDRLISRLENVRPGDIARLPADLRELLKAQWQMARQQENEDAMARWLEQSGKVKIYPENLPQP